MTKGIKIIIALVVVIAIVAIGWIWYGGGSNSVNSTATTITQPSVSTNNQTASAQNSVSPDAGLTTSASDTSDTALQSDLNSVDGQMNGLNSDNASVDQSLTQTQ